MEGLCRAHCLQAIRPSTGLRDRTTKCSSAKRNGLATEHVRSHAVDVRKSFGVGLGVLGAGAVGFLDPAFAGELLRQEPSNALSLPTWIIHVSSVIEWFVAMGLVWQYAEVSNKPEWKGLTWGMVPLFAGALTACTWHFFYNSPDLEFLVAMQAFLTFVGNATCWLAAYRIFKASQAAEESV
ncbi:hypothetical protein BSKO_00548 [Bryopsis sp. KO-2023]|nr:hypothetical protein BSKO_00548 [Bryopsis sp. KO-2023]